MIKRCFAALFLGLASLTISTTMASAEKFSIQPVVNPSEVANFPLSEGFLNKMEAVQNGILVLPAENDAPGTGNDNTISGLIAVVEGRPKLMELLKKNNLTAHDYVVGSMALGAALSAAASENEVQIFDETQSVSKTNLEFAKKYAERIRTLLGG